MEQGGNGCHLQPFTRSQQGSRESEAAHPPRKKINCADKGGVLRSEVLEVHEGL